MLKKTSVPKHILFLFSLFVSGMVLFSLFRLILLANNMHLLDAGSLKLLPDALLRGLVFDMVVNSYILAIPFLILSYRYLNGSGKTWYHRAVKAHLTVFYLTAFSISAADIPYFAFYNSRLTKGILNWLDNIPLMTKAVFTDAGYYPYLALFMLISVAFGIWINHLYKRSILQSDPCSGDRLPEKVSATLLAAFIIFLGCRGDWDFRSKPAVTQDAFFSDYAFINQLALNPVFNFADSFREFEIRHFSDKTAIEKVQRYLNISPKYDSPIAREITFEEGPVKPNVVLVLMESMSSYKMGMYGNKKNLTPHLDSIAGSSLTFKNIYTAGVHTHTGIFSTLFSFPTVMRNKLMSSSNGAGQPFTGIPHTLRKNGYQTIFFCTGSRNFDNMGGFLTANGFQQIISGRDYPEKEAVNGWGVPDHYMFETSIDRLNMLAKNRKPFLAVYMTISTHTPHIIPKGIDFKPASERLDDQIYEYADWSIARFMKLASAQDWFEDTIFVFIADHGQNFDPLYEMPLSYHHTPLIFFSPRLIKPREYQDIGLQVDVFPTLMGILRMPYTNNTLGIDLRRDKRPFAFFSTDDKVGCLNERFFLIIKNNGKEALYDYRQRELTDRIGENRVLVDDMKDYTYSMLQTAQWLIASRKAGPQEK